MGPEPPERQTESVNPAPPLPQGLGRHRSWSPAIWPSYWGKRWEGSWGAAGGRRGQACPRAPCVSRTGRGAPMPMSSLSWSMVGLRGGVLPPHLPGPRWVLPQPAGCWHRGLKDRTARAWPPPCPSFHRLSPFMHPERHRSPNRKGGPSAVAPGPPPPQAFPRLTAEPLWPASPRSPGTPTSPYTRGGGQRVSAGSAHTWVGGEGCRYSRGHQALLRGQPRPALQLCPAGEG